jgi:hypothetical protein
MKKVGIIMIVTLLAISGIMAAMAYTTADVTSNASLIVRSTDMALLRFDNYGADMERNYTTGITDGEMWFDFTQGTGKNGFQPNSIYTYVNLFRIINNQPNANIQVTAETDLPYLWLWDREGNVLIENGASTGNTSPGNTYYTVEFRIPSGAPMNWQPQGSYIVFHSVSIPKTAVN